MVAVATTTEHYSSFHDQGFDPGFHTFKSEQCENTKYKVLESLPAVYWVGVVGVVLVLTLCVPGGFKHSPDWASCYLFNNLYMTCFLPWGLFLWE